MSIDISSLQTFTAADLLTLVEYDIAQVLAGHQSYTTSGRVVVRAPLEVLFARRDQLKDEIAAADAGEAGGGNVLVKFGEPQ